MSDSINIQGGSKIGCCIAGCNFVNYEPIKKISLLERLLNYPKDVLYYLTVNRSMQLAKLCKCL